ncbi:uncharacterized protein BKA78DRAFT_139586 [Phyllosticta capitalensis]|uniref:uncharacterized protein n=1 Tax=Phyllosticta capitalensis TaxID=121624 RepID=UPI00312D81B7
MTPRRGMTPNSPPVSLLPYLLPPHVCKGLCQRSHFDEQHYHDTAKDHCHDRNCKVRCRLSRYQVLQMSFRSFFRARLPLLLLPHKNLNPPFFPKHPNTAPALAKQGLQHQHNHHSANPHPLPVLTLKLSSAAPSSSNQLRRVGPFKSFQILVSDVGKHRVVLADFHDVV